MLLCCYYYSVWFCFYCFCCCCCCCCLCRCWYYCCCCRCFCWYWYYSIVVVVFLLIFCWICFFVDVVVYVLLFVVVVVVVVFNDDESLSSCIHFYRKMFQTKFYTFHSNLTWPETYFKSKYKLLLCQIYSFKTNARNKRFKGTVTIIVSHFPCKDANAWFTMVPSKYLLDQKCGRYCRFLRFKSI